MNDAALEAAWRAAWPEALAAWSSYTLLREPVYAHSKGVARDAGFGGGELAAIRLLDQAVIVNFERIRALGLQGDAKAILAHEIGHHVFVPGNLTDNARLLATIGKALPGLPEPTAMMVANLWADLLINDRLQRGGRADMAAVYRRLAVPEADAAWTVYTRTMEHLWRLPAGTLTPKDVSPEQDADAALLARIVRAFASDWLAGARRFAAVLYPHLAQDLEARREARAQAAGLGDLQKAGSAPPGEKDAEAIPDGLTSIEPGEEEGQGGDLLPDLEDSDRPPPKEPSRTRSEGQCRQPYQYGQLLRALGLALDDTEITARYYRERALPHLIPFPTRRVPAAADPLPEGLEPWLPGEPLERLDVFQSVLGSPVLVPGVSTVQRVYGETQGFEAAPRPVDLDIYVDCSGSMPNPVAELSYLALAGTILALSALRAGARVHATLWSGAGQFDETRGFIRDEKRVLAVICGYIAGGTTFPLHVLRDTYASRSPQDPPAHIVVISDDGADTMLANDERRRPGAEICAAALARARGGGTLVLNIDRARTWLPQQALEQLGFRVYRVSRWEDLVEFARRFVQDTYGEQAHG